MHNSGIDTTKYHTKPDMHIIPCVVLVQPRNARPDMTVKLGHACKNQSNKQKLDILCSRPSVGLSPRISLTCLIKQEQNMNTLNLGPSYVSTKYEQPQSSLTRSEIDGVHVLYIYKI